MLNIFKDFGLFAICAILFSSRSLSSTLPRIVPRSQGIMYPSLQEARNSVTSCSELFNFAVIAKSLYFSMFTKYARVSASICNVFYWSAICFQSAIPTSSFVLLVNQSNCLLTPATSSPLTVHLHSMPTATLQSRSQGLILGISLLFAVSFLFLPLLLYSLSRHFCPQYQPPTRNQDTIIHIPLEQFTAPEPTSFIYGIGFFHHI